MSNITKVIVVCEKIDKLLKTKKQKPHNPCLLTAMFSSSLALTLLLKERFVFP